MWKGIVFGEVKLVLEQEELPRYYCNILPFLPKPLNPPLNPATMKPAAPEDLMRIFTKEGVRQEMCMDERVRIPEEVREAYLRLGRPTPLYRARRLEKYLRTKARIYYKREDVNPCGSHKPNTAVAQAFYASKEGVERLETETGAGQWGTALSYACMLFGLECEVFMTRSSYDSKPYRRTMIELFGGTVHPSPSDITESGRRFLKEMPDHPGSLGVAISEAIEMTLRSEKTRYSLGSVLNHVLLHQTVIGEETMLQFKQIDATPDLMIGCIGGGSNFAGFCYPFVRDRLQRKIETKFLAVEPTAVPSTTRGEYRYDYGDTAELTPLIEMYTLGHKFIPPPIHAAGLRYHGKAPSLSLLVKEGVVKSVAYEQDDVFEAARMFVRTEGIIPAPETAHAIKAVIDEARKCSEEKIIAFNFSGHGLLDLGSYELQGR
ncbi:TrpB-like pyridoxal phosphate-dependent enzyme [Candidatus Micrarchaeota archaeon]|nr:TrpB-like pyridoxal phosphate-dependent enzyme [Candidatus Micrarchaeota archaeon]